MPAAASLIRYKKHTISTPAFQEKSIASFAIIRHYSLPPFRPGKDKANANERKKKTV